MDWHHILKMKSLLLIGFMGAGKTTVGSALGEHFDCEFLDTDQLISDSIGLSVEQIFSVYGEDTFRQAETTCLEKLSGTRNAIIATGGGIVLRPENWQVMRAIGPSIFLHSSESELRQRLSSPSGRPLADDSDWETVMGRYRDRLPLYRQADIQVNTSGKNVHGIVSEIISQLEILDLR